MIKLYGGGAFSEQGGFGFDNPWAAPAGAGETEPPPTSAVGSCGGTSRRCSEGGVLPGPKKLALVSDVELLEPY